MIVTRRIRWTQTLSLLLALPLLLPCAPAARAAVADGEGGVLFSYTDPGATSVSLAGSFNDWNTTASSMSDQDGDGTWTVVVKLAAGSYEYKFVVNGGTWVADPDNPLTGGEYGNSLVKVGADLKLAREGSAAAVPAIPSGTPVVSNTPLHNRVYLGGFFRMLMQSTSDDNGDARLRLERPDDQFNLDVTANLSPRLWGTVRLQLKTGEGGANELATDLYKAQSNFIDDHFQAQAFYNEEAFDSGDPFELLGHQDLRGTIGREQRPFGQGTQGVVLRATPWGSNLALLYADTYDEDIFNPSAPTVLVPRKEGLNQNTGTDVVGLRWTRPLGARAVGLTYRGEFSDWWVNFTSSVNSYPADLVAFRAASQRRDQDKSDNFELANDRHTVAVDVTSPVPRIAHLNARAALGYVWYAARWDLGNREKVQGNGFVNGKVDIPIGNERGYRGKLLLDHEWKGLTTVVSHEVRWNQGMDAGENFVVYRTVPGSMLSDRDYYVDAAAVTSYQDVNGTDALDILRLGPRPQRQEHVSRLDLAYRVGQWEALLGYERDRENLDYTSLLGSGPATLDRWTWRTSPQLHWRPFAAADQHITLESQFLRTADPLQFTTTGAAAVVSPVPGQGNGELLRLNSTEWTLSGLVPTGGRLRGKDLALRFDLRYIRYAGKGDLLDANGQVLDLDRNFFSAFAAFVYRPANAVQLHVGYGVDPTFYKVISPEGWPNGRQQFRDGYLFDLRLDPYNPVNVLRAEQALTDRRQVVFNAVVTF